MSAGYRAPANANDWRRPIRLVAQSLEPISKSPEEANEASELYETEEVLGVVFPTDEDAALPVTRAAYQARAGP